MGGIIELKRLLIWGTGKIAEQVLQNGINGQVIGFIESEKRKELFQGKPVYMAAEVMDDMYDFIIVANTYVEDIYNICKNEKIDLGKVIFLFPIKKREGFFEKEEVKGILGEKNFCDYCEQFNMRLDAFLGQDIETYRQLNKRANFAINMDKLWPIITDKYALAGTMGNYFWQDLWAAKLIIRSGVKRHFDIGSRIDGFIAHLLAADIEVSMIDVREFPAQVENLRTIVDDATSLRQIPDESIESLSALCSIEHFGLGRYGDAVDPEACFQCFQQMQKKIKTGGKAYISVPIGQERVEFNAHRVFYAKTIIDCFHSMELKEFSCVADDGKGIEYDADLHGYDCDRHNGEYRYGLFYFVKN